MIPDYETLEVQGRMPALVILEHLQITVNRGLVTLQDGDLLLQGLLRAKRLVQRLLETGQDLRGHLGHGEDGLLLLLRTRKDVFCPRRK